jgi:hypothetical protein
LKRWFRWHSKLRPTRTPADSILARPQIKPRATRCLQEIEVYQKLFYTEKVRAKVEQECNGKELTAGDRLRIIKRLSREQWFEATDEEKAAVASRLAELEMELARQRDEDREAEGDPRDGVLTPSQLQRCVTLPPSLFYY